MTGFITWTANPVLFQLGFFAVRWYSLMFLIGFTIGYYIIYKMFKHEGARQEWIDKLLIYVAIATIVGSRLGHVFFYQWDYYSQHPLDIIKIWEGGLASHGGTIGIIIAILLYSKYVTKKSPIWTFDRLVVPVALVGALIRIGNLFNHEIYGHDTTLPWGFRFIENLHGWMAGADPIFTAPCHPTQIYEALAYLALFSLLMVMYWKYNCQERKGLIFGVFLTWLFSARFFIEFIKNVQVEFEEGMALNMGQWLSVPFIIAGLVLIVYALSHEREHIDFPERFADDPLPRRKRN
ncbi:MAG: prolipoprotein diacylglyceryl transferase [Bacteroidales bacterium]|nr:prolipoprotein diacylglyceryl transferase [Bacteroidales bacterium]